MSNQLSRRAVESLTANETSEVWLVLAKVESSAAALPLYLVNNTQSITSNGLVYSPCAFAISLPEQSSESGNRPCTVAIDNTDFSIMELVTKSIGSTIHISLSVILSQTPNVIERGPLKFILRNVRADKNTVKGDLYDFYLADRTVPRLKYTQQNFAGLF